jgi:hypothetical protein
VLRRGAEMCGRGRPRSPPNSSGVFPFLISCVPNSLLLFLVSWLLN